MPQLSLDLLGSYNATIDGERVSAFSSAKVRALLAYLAVEPGHPHSREALAGLLWPDEPHVVAHTNLRQALVNLRQVLGDRTAASPVLAITRETVEFLGGPGTLVDVVSFTALIARSQSHAHRHATGCRSCAQHLEQAVDLYRGDFLADLFVNDCLPFEEWALLRREEVRQLASEALYGLAEYHTRNADYEQARRYAARQLELDPWREEAHCQMMRALALDGQRSAALAQYERCRLILAKEFGAEPSGETRELFEKIRAGIPLPNVQPLLRNWPALPTSFVGRRHELAQLAQRVEVPQTRLVTLAGLGGAGKTRLALQVAEQEVLAFRDGACFVSLAGLSGATAIVHAIAAALGYTIANRADPAAELAGYLRQQELLLLLDNCEYETGLPELLGRLLRACPGLTVLATARERLNLTAEWVFEVEGLATSVSSADPDCVSCDAVELFAARMQQTGVEHGLSEADRAAVARICDLVDGLPLAIELAAGWTRVLPIAEIAIEVDRNIGFWEIDRQRAGDRERSLSAILDQAWALLPTREQQVFRQLAVFQHGFRRSEAVQVVQVPAAESAPQKKTDRPYSAETALDAALGLLIDRFLLRRMGSGRYRLHPLLHQLAEQKLAAAPELEIQARTNHARTFALLLADSASRLKSADQERALLELSAENANLQVAWQWSVSRADLGLIGLSIEALDSYFDLRSWSQEAVQAFEDATHAFGRLVPSGAEEGRVLGALLARLGMHYYRLNRLEDAKGHLDRSIALLAVNGSNAEQALALLGLGNIAFWQGDYDGAERCYLEGLARARQAASRWLAASLTYLLSDCASIAGDHPRAMAGYEESLAVFRELGDPRMIAVALSNLADGYRRQGCAPDARPLYLESLTIAERIGHRRLVANNLNGLAELAYDLGDYARARTNYEASLEISRAIGSRLLTNLNLAGVANTACEQGDLRAARLYLREVLRDVLENQSWAVLPIVMIGVAHMLATQDDVARTQAVQLLARARCHRLTWDEYRARAAHLLNVLAAELPAPVYARALADTAPVEPLIRAVLGMDLPEDALTLADSSCVDLLP